MSQLSLWDRLRQDTAALHKEIESVMPLMRPGFTREQYVAHLQRLYGFYLPLERSYSASWELLENGARRRLPRLQQDLRELNVQALDTLPQCTALAAIRTPAEMVGTLYVIEGSTLGAQVIRRHLAEALNLEDRHMSFYIGYGSATGAMWQKFKAHAPTFIGDTDHAAVSVRACATFAALMNWLKD